MIKLFDINTFECSKPSDKLPLQCERCKNTFFLEKRTISYEEKKKVGKGSFCSKECYSLNLMNGISVFCKNCNVHFVKNKHEFLNTKNHFCSKSCSATYNNKHKTTGNRRSKLETYLQEQLTSLYPNLEIHYNRKDVINSELDIYIPSLKLAFELNGIFHFEPIYGSEKLSQIQNNDHRKFQACAENDISLCVIDTSHQKYFKEESSKKYLLIIQNTINNF